MKNNTNWIERLNVLNFAEVAARVEQPKGAGAIHIEGHAPANQGEAKTPKTYRIDPNKISLGTKASAPNGDRLPSLPPPEFGVELVEINGEQVFKLTAVSYGRAEVKEIEKKDAKNDYKLTGQMTKRLSLGWTRRPIMVEDEESGKQVRQLIDVPGPNGEMLQFALTGTLEIAGKLTQDVVTRSDRQQ